MTPGARVAAAIAVLDQIIAGAPAEKALTTWARGSRFAGSKDRAAIRDHVFDVLRRKGSLSSGGMVDGRRLMLRLASEEGRDVHELFSGDGYAPAVVTAAEMAWLSDQNVGSPQDDIPAWLWPAWEESLGSEAHAAVAALQARAALYLRVNPRLATIDEAMASLAAEDITADVHPEVSGCLEVTHNERRVKNAAAYTSGMVEIQDAASQIAVARLPVASDARVLDYCAGGGGKALAVAARVDCAVTAHDVAFARMTDIAPRAARAGVAITTIDSGALRSEDPFDLVICDAPCSGSGTWRRTPDAKWRLTHEKLNEYNALQSEVLATSLAQCRSGGTVAYMTCSVLHAENRAIVDHVKTMVGGFEIQDELKLVPGLHWDGFYLCALQKLQ